MCLLQGTKGKWPCPICLAPLKELSELSKTFNMLTVSQVKHALAVYQQRKSEGEAILKALGLRLVSVSFNSPGLTFVAKQLQIQP